MGRLVIWVAVFVLFTSCVGTKIKVNKILQKCKTWFDWKKCKTPVRLGCPIQLDMAPNSVDDMYDNCEEKMKKKIEKTFLPNEQNKNENFRKAWDESKKYYETKWENKKNESLLKKEQIMALHAYTLTVPPLHDEFNNAVRTQKSKYKTAFQYHALHFYVTTALRTLKNNSENCITVFRRSHCKFTKDVPKETVRFGAFASSSLYDYSGTEFGEESCFEITTCFGADISQYSKYEKEREVLVPPYEVFKVTKIKISSKPNELPCKVVYTLKSTEKICSNLNCAMFKKKVSAWPPWKHLKNNGCSVQIWR